MFIFTRLLFVIFIVCNSLGASVFADSHGDRLDKIESQVQDVLIKMKGLEKKTKNTPEIKVGPGLKVKSGKNEFKIGGRMHLDLGVHDVDAPASCEVAHDQGGSCFTDGTNFRRLRLGFSGKYGEGFYYKAQVDWGASAKQQSTLGDADGMNDITSVDEAYMGYKLGKNSTISIGKQKIPLSFAESTSSNDLTFIERSPAVDAMTDHTLGPKRISLQYRNWNKKFGYLFEAAAHGGGDMTPTENFDEQQGLTARLAYAPIHFKTHALHLGGWYDFTNVDYISNNGDTSMEWDYRIGLNVSDEKPIDADIGSDLAEVKNMTHYGGELAYLYGGFWFGSEWLWGEMERASTGTNPGCTSVKANMGYLEMGYSYGGNRRYTIKKGGWKRPKVKKPINKGGLGIHEFGIRRTLASLNGLCNDGSYAGQGAMNNWTLGWNWQLTNNNRIMVNYIMAHLDEEAVDEVTGLNPGATTLDATNDGDTQVRVFGIRFQTNW